MPCLRVALAVDPAHGAMPSMDQQQWVALLCLTSVRCEQGKLLSAG